MSRCKNNCERENLYASFLQQMEKASIRTTARQALQKLEEHAAGRDLKLCELGVGGMREFVIRLRSLEQQGISADIVSHWINIIGFFYDFLQQKGCLEENPVRVLKAQEIERLLAHMTEYGFRQQDLGDEDEEG